ncbi:MAG: hypothetical protein OCD76_06920 [Reichenbachiella sp.]
MKLLSIYLRVFVLFFGFFVAVSCADDSIDDSNQEDPSENELGEGEVNEPITTNVRTFIFGHSLILHATDTDETTVPHWVYLLALEAGYEFVAGGQYGFLPQHAELPPNSQWGFDLVPGVWDADFQDFNEANVNTILLTAGNFVQWQPATTNYYNMDLSPVDATQSITDWAVAQEDSMTIYIYENWPDMASYVEEGEGVVFDPTVEQFQNYNEYLLGDFHDWWIEYQDVMIESRPEQNIKMIPVGPIMAKLLTQAPLNGIPILDLYEDNAPHGRPTIYFLASLITYSAMYGVKAPETFEIPSTIHSLVGDNYQETIDFIWEELTSFEDAEGNSRVW